MALAGPGSAGLSLSGTTISGTPTTDGAVNVVETLSGATNTPRTTNTALSVVAAGAATLMPLWQAQLNKAKAGQGQALVYAAGDSTTAGSQSGDTADGYNNNAYGNSPPIVANKLFQTDMGLPSIGNSLTGMGDSGMGSGSTLSYRPDLRNGQWGSTAAPEMSIGGAMAGGGSTTTLGFNDDGTKKYSRLDIMYPFATNYSTYNVSYPGASGVQISGTKTDSGAPDELRFSTFTYAASTTATSGAPAVSGLAKIASTTTNNRIIAVIARDMMASGVMIMNGGWSGATTASWRGAAGNPDGLSPIYGPPQALRRLITELGVKLVSVNLGINDARSDSLGVAVATFTTRLGEMVDDIKANGADALLIVPHWVATGSRPQSKQVELHQAVKDVATAKGVAVMDITTIPGFETLDAATAAGYMHTDGIHLNKLGSSVVGTAYYNFIKNG
ncbi:SGNH/GDSL hydrolase family protein [Sphingomonas sp. T9W2]|uniref:SGNH/GDSL hydrolase family protein n=1 Tax=Sphingomonas sp. T9W2 TaxID=3143183 RepID=UPI0031F58332